MEEIVHANTIKELTKPFLEKGFTFEYFYEKGGDSSCAYICRYRKGKDFFDWRELSGGTEITFIVYANGQYDFPSLKTKFPKEYRAFCIKHLFKKTDLSERRAFVAELLNKELQSGKDNFFGIKL